MSNEFISHQPQVSLESTSETKDDYGISELKWVVKAGGEEPVAWLTGKIFKAPQKLIWLTNLHAIDPVRSKQLSSMLMRNVEQKMLDEGAVGMLHDHVGLLPNTPKQAEGMYERHGWVYYDDQLVFNMPSDPKRRSEISAMLNLITKQYIEGEVQSELA